MESFQRAFEEPALESFQIEPVFVEKNKLDCCVENRNIYLNKRRLKERVCIAEINLQSLEDTQVRYISHRYTLDKYTFGNYSFAKYTFGKYTFGKSTFGKYTF